MNDHHLAKGSIYLITSHGLFYASGYLIHCILARITTPTTYGTIGVLLSLLTVLQIFLIHGVPTAAAKYLSEGVNGREVRSRSLLLQFTSTLIVSFFVYSTASLIADLFHDRSYVPYVRFLTIVIVVRSMNQLFNSFFNGYREFTKQSIHMAIDSFPRALFVVVLVWMGYGIYGVLGGYAGASLVGLTYALAFFRPKKTNESIGYRQILNFSFPVIIFSAFFHLITSLDLFFIKSSSIAGEYIGFYTSARVLSTVFVIVSVSFSSTLLPSISRSFSRGDTEHTKSYIQTSLRYLLIIFFPIALFISVYSKAVLALLFTPEYAKAGDALSILIWGWFFLQISFVLSAMINASGRTNIPAQVAGISLLVSFISNYCLVSRYGIEGGATATFIAGMVCIVGGFYFVHRIFRVGIDLHSTLKLGAGSLVLFVISTLVKAEGAFLLAWILGLFSLYVVFLVLTRAINNDDIRLIRELYRSFVSPTLTAQP